MAGSDVLIVEDDVEIAELIRFHASREGFATRVVHSGSDALRAVERSVPVLVVLDVMLPDVDGLEVTRRIRKRHTSADLPIVMVTAKGEESDIVAGLELGADDYVTKPFSPAVLIARIRNVLRRWEERGEDAESSCVELFGGEVQIDPGAHVVRVGGREVALTLTEFRLLEYLARRPGFVRTRDQIVSAVRGEGAVLSGRAVDVHVASLRQKLESHSWVVETVRGVGYRCATTRPMRDTADR
ncbi:MAG: response regulator transcription factor [Planctomycetota bacterium]|jgi:two-component system phosphate regulon response regulator PhoB